MGKSEVKLLPLFKDLYSHPSKTQPVLAEDCYPGRAQPVILNNPKGLSFLNDGAWKGCAFSASTGYSF